MGDAVQDALALINDKYDEDLELPLDTQFFLHALVEIAEACNDKAAKVVTDNAALNRAKFAIKGNYELFADLCKPYILNPYKKMERRHLEELRYYYSNIVDACKQMRQLANQMNIALPRKLLKRFAHVNAGMVLMEQYCLEQAEAEAQEQAPAQARVRYRAEFGQRAAGRAARQPLSTAGTSPYKRLLM